MVWAKGYQLQNGKYVIEEVLGQGGFGITYKALHVPLNYYVVVKTPNEHLKHNSDYEKYVRRFIKEGRMLAKLSQDPHPHIVRVQDLFQEQDTYCLIMDFVDGENLFQVVKKRGRITEKAATKYIQQIGSALSAIHKAGLVHRDAHPGNIIVCKDGNAILIDFGIAKEFVPTTQTFMDNVGNKAFAPYEQRHKGSREPNVDVYCLAATLYFILTGKYPTQSATRKLSDIRLIPPKNINYSISKEVNRAILRGMALEAKDRPQTMEKWLETIFESSSIMSYISFSVSFFDSANRFLDPVYKVLNTVHKKVLQRQKTTKKQDSGKNTMNFWESKFHHTFSEISSSFLEISIREARKLPWMSLIGMIIAHGIVSFVLVSFQPNLYIWIFCWAVAIAITGALDLDIAIKFSFIVFIASVWTSISPHSWAIAFAGAFIWILGLADATEKLKYRFFSIRDRLFILSMTSFLGIGLGWLAWNFCPLFNSPS